MTKVQDILYAGDECPIVTSDTCFRDVLEIMDTKKLGAVCVVDGGKLVGLITDGDVRRLILKTQQSLPMLFLIDAGKLMTPAPNTISPASTFEEALAKLEEYEFWVLPVVDDEQRFVGLLHMHALLKAMVSTK